MHWLLVTARHHPSQGGIGACAWNFLHAAADHGWTIDLVTRASPFLRDVPRSVRVHCTSTPDEAPDFADRIPHLRKIELIRPYRYGLWSLAAARALHAMDIRPDAIEFVDCQAEGFVSLTSDILRHHFEGVPMIVSAHTPMFIEETINGSDPRRFGRSVYHEWERKAIAAADGVMAPSRLLADRLDRRDCAVISLPLSSEAASVSAQRVDRRLIRAVGTIQPRKGFDVWVSSLNVLFERHESARAELIGDDTPTAPGGGSFSDHLASLLEPRFRSRLSMRRPLSHAEALDAIATAGVLVVPSRFEAFGYVAAEALQCGRPVLVSDAVGLREHVPTLPAFPVDDHAALADSQLDMLLNLAAAERDARMYARTLAEACAVERHLSQRRKLVQSIRDDRTQPRRSDHDAMEAMDRFLAEVERREGSAGAAGASLTSSSDVS